MKTSKSLYSRLALITSVTLVVGYFVVYAAWSSLTSEDVAPGATITTGLMTKIKDNFDDLNTRVSNFGFSAGNVGIGIAGPASKLHIMHSSNATEDQSTALTDVGIGVRLQNATAGQVGIGTKNSVGSPYEGDFIIYNQWFNGTQYVWKERMRVRSDGNVGIGTTTPTAKLHVAGNMKLNSNTIRQVAPQISTVYADGASNAYGYCSFVQNVLSQAKAGCTVTLRQNAYGTAIVSGGTMVDSVNYIYRIQGAYSGQVTCICMEWE